MTRAIGYRRVSKSEQAQNGLGLDAQADAIRATAARLNLSLAEVFTDAGLSGALPIEQRPGLLAAVTALRRGDTLLIAKRDRLGRDVINVALAERLVQRRGARIISARGEGSDDNEPASVLLRRLLDSFAEHERLIIGARTKAALAVKRSRGERISGIAPYGFSFSKGKLVPNRNEQRCLSLLRELRASGLPIRKVAATLNARGYRLRSGQPWCHPRVLALSRDIQRKARKAA